MEYEGFIYEWTNKVNNKKYLGAHIGADDDHYVGSGKQFLKDLKLHGMMNFERKILEYVSDKNKLKDRENYYLQLADAKDNPEYYNSSMRSSGLKVNKTKVQQTRKTCPYCSQRPVAVNLIKNGITYYRSKCETCIKRTKKIKPPTPRWELSGYKKKPTCDRCGFKAKYAGQLLVYHVDGNMNNSSLRNLKTICLNCVVDVKKSSSTWRPGDLEPDS
jgi:hypothetical protein